MKRNKILIGLIVIVSIIIFFYLIKEKETSVIERQEINSNSMISMMYETEAGSGIYEMNKEAYWLSEGYIFNENLSNCENGSKLSWNDVDKSLLVPTQKSDKCIAYFDQLSITAELEVENPQDVYFVGDTIVFTLTLTNKADNELPISIKNTLAGASNEGFWANTEETINSDGSLTATIGGNETILIKYEYVVSRDDAGSSATPNSIQNTMEISYKNPDNEQVVKINKTSNSCLIENIYKLTIYYVYSDGSTAYGNYEGYYLEGETFNIVSPEIGGYSPDYAFIRSDASGFPAQDVTLTVTYTRIPSPAPLP